MRRALLLLCFSLQACSLSAQSLLYTAKAVVKTTPDTVVSDEQIRELPFASAYVRVGEGHRAFVVLAYVEAGQQKWVSKDRTMIVTQQGRLVKTLGLRDNVLRVFNADGDPLADGVRLVEGARWNHVLQWSDSDSPLSLIVESTFTRGKRVTLTVPGRKIDCQVWHEQVDARFLSVSWENTFWIDRVTGQVWKSKQKIGPYSAFVEFTLLKPAR